MLSSKIVLVLILVGLVSVQAAGVRNKKVHVKDVNDFLIGWGFDLIYSLQNAKDFIYNNVKSEKCLTDIESLFISLGNLSDDGLWAYKMIDASTKIPSGILDLNVGGWMGSFEECINIRSKKYNIQGNYCLGTLYIDLSEFTQTSMDKMAKKVQLFTEQKQNFQAAYPTASYPSFGICVPDGCTEDDLASLVTALNLDLNIPFECQTYEKANPPITKGAWIAIAGFAAYFSIIIMSTLYDLYIKNNQKEPAHNLLISFSVHTNLKKLLSTNKNSTDLSCISGIKVLSMAWVVFGHSFSIMVTGPVDNSVNILKYLDKIESMIFVNAVHAVDTFLMISGLLVVYVYMMSKKKGVKFNLLIFYLHRYMRLTPGFLAAIIVSMSFLQYMGSGPHWSFIVNYFQGFCQKRWWIALLYLQNYLNVTNMCIGQTWYLDIDWQLYVFAPIFLLMLTWKPKLGQSALFAALVAFIAIPFYVTWVNRLPSLISNLYGNLLGFQNKYYLRTHTRASPWFVGAIVGYYIAKYKMDYHHIRLNKYFVGVMWLIVLTLIPVCIFGGNKELRAEKYNQYAHAFYNSLVRPLWAACISWIIFACSTGHGFFINSWLSLPIFQILGRLTYSIYLLHVSMLFMIVYGSKTAAHFSIFKVAYTFWGNAMMSLFLSILWVLAFESPIIAIESYFLAKYKQKKDVETKNQEKV